MEGGGSAAAEAGWPPLSCANYSGAQVKPLAISTENKRMFTYGGASRVLIGASADAGCLLSLLSLPADAASQCNIANYPQVYEKLENRPSPTSPVSPLALNKTRIWVTLGGAYNPPDRIANEPFKWVPAVGSEPAYWLLDAPALATTNPTLPAYFDRLRNVVNEARKHKLFNEPEGMVAPSKVVDPRSRPGRTT